MDQSGKGGSVRLLLLSGMGSATVYGILYRYEDLLMDLMSRGKEFFWLPVVIALLVSLVHGTFTAQFWSCIGIQAKQ
ncbi:MAG: hypothetical protein HQL58_06875 [Magnetococcales bacterium]|nr:hypothetical protein [Magnetococcales bacterium]